MFIARICATTLRALAAALLLVTAAPASEPVLYNLRQVDYYPSSTSNTPPVEVAHDGTIALVLESSTTSTWVTLFDLAALRSNPEPRLGSIEIAKTYTHRGDPAGISIDLPYAAAAIGDRAKSTIAVLDVNNLNDPGIIYVHRLYPSGGQLTDTEVRGNRVCISSTDRPTRIMTISDGNVISGDTELPTRPADRITFDGSRLIASADSTQIVEVPADASQARLKSDTIVEGADVLLFPPVLDLGDRILCGSADDLTLFGATNPSQPVLLGRSGAGGSPTTITALTPHLLIVAGESSLAIIDFSNPQLPVVRAAWYNLAVGQEIARGGVIPDTDGTILVFTPQGVHRFEYLGPLRRTSATGLMVN